MISVNVKFFALARDIAGKEDSVLSIPDESTASAVLQILCNTYPRLNELRDHIRLAVNWEYVSADQILHEKDEIAVIPPVSGG